MERRLPALAAFLVERWQPLANLLLFKAPSGPCIGGGIAPKANREARPLSAAHQGFAVGREVLLAIVLALPTAIGLAGFAHIEQELVPVAAAVVDHEIQSCPLLQGFWPAPELSCLTSM